MLGGKTEVLGSALNQYAQVSQDDILESGVSSPTAGENPPRFKQPADRVSQFHYYCEFLHVFLDIFIGMSLAAWQLAGRHHFICQTVENTRNKGKLWKKGNKWECRLLRQAPTGCENCFQVIIKARKIKILLFDMESMTILSWWHFVKLRRSRMESHFSEANAK